MRAKPWEYLNRGIIRPTANKISNTPIRWINVFLLGINLGIIIDIPCI